MTGLKLDLGFERLQQAATRNELEACVRALRDDLDVEHLVYHAVGTAGEQYAVLTYEPGWVERYVEQDYARIDPVVQGCFRRFHPVDWKHLDWSGRQSRALLSEAMDHGVGNQGYSIPIRGPHGQFAMLTATHRCSDTLWQKFTSGNVADLIVLAHFINQKALEIDRPAEPAPVRGLSPREVNVLTLLAMGMNRAHAAQSLSISENTFRSYVESARCKLDANNTMQAVARAVSEGLIVI